MKRKTSNITTVPTIYSNNPNHTNGMCLRPAVGQDKKSNSGQYQRKKFKGGFKICEGMKVRGN